MFSGFRFGHVGINSEDRDSALELVNFICTVFGQKAIIPEKGSPRIGDSIEVCPGGKNGTKGHISFYTDDIEAGIKEVESKGIELDYDRAKKNPDGSLYLIYLKEEYCGFAIHILGPKKN